MRRSVLLACLVAAACGTTGPTTGDGPAAGCADVVDVVATPAADGTWRFDVTVASGDTGWDRYADAWEVRLADGTVVGVRDLTHPHVQEQPFTRSLSGVQLPAGSESVVVAAHDSVAGFCGSTLEVRLTP